MNSLALTALIAILVCAVINFLLRAVPFLLFGGEKGMPKVMAYLAGILPAAIMAVLVVYCLKGVTTSTLHDNIAILVASAFVVLLHVWKKIRYSAYSPAPHSICSFSESECRLILPSEARERFIFSSHLTQMYYLMPEISDRAM